MARGYPDFFGFSIFPSFGVPTEEVPGPIVIANGDRETIFQSVGKGKSYGGELWWDGNADCLDTVTLYITMDGVSFAYETVGVHLAYGFYVDESRFARVISACLWAADTGHVTYGFNRDITWGKEVLIEVKNSSGANITANGRFRWAKVI